jgi:hypothetical protein
MKAVNSVGKELIDDFSRAITASPARTVESICREKYNPQNKKTAFDKCVSDKARKAMYQQHYNVVLINGEEQIVPTNGVFCSGRYSYIWNTAYSLNEEYERKNPLDSYVGVYVENGDVKNQSFRLLKVTDFNRSMCMQHLRSDTYLYDSNLEYNINYTPEVVEELLENSENDLALYDMTIFSPTIHSVTSAGFYSGTFVLATLRGGINIFTTGEFCSEPPDNLATDFAYCAINKFNFSVRAAGEKMRGE